VNSIQRFDNEKLKERVTYLLWLLLLVVGLISFPILGPVIKPHRYYGSIMSWAFTLLFIIILTVYFIFHKRLVSITFDDSSKTITLTTMTLINGDKTDNYKYSDISFTKGKDPASFRKKSTEFIEIYSRKQKVVKLEKTSIGEYSFDNIVNTFQHIKNSS
jgi:hypothetical protein